MSRSPEKTSFGTSSTSQISQTWSLAVETSKREILKGAKSALGRSKRSSRKSSSRRLRVICFSGNISTDN
jgi:hypothetical protein